MKRRPLDAKEELLEEFERALRVSEYLVGVLPRRLWRAEPPDGHGRSIAATVAHMQGVRRTFAKMAGAPVALALDRKAARFPLNKRGAARSALGVVEARRALRQSLDVLARLFRESLGQDQSRVKGMPRRTVNMIFYLVQHEAHHRGQICRLAKSLGHEFSGDDVMRIWGWKKLP